MLYLEITVHDAPVVAVLYRLQQCADEIPRLFFVVNYLRYDTVEQLPSCSSDSQPCRTCATGVPRKKKKKTKRYSNRKGKS